MPSTVHVVARFVARPGQEQALKAALTALIAPTRRELACYQYDLLENPSDARDLCFVERWESDKAFDRHAESEHVRRTLAQVEGLVETAPDIRRYVQV
jgi:quinol monooxygenase YgiN